jgi:site-specific recombinase XerD
MKSRKKQGLPPWVYWKNGAYRLVIPGIKATDGNGKVIKDAQGKPVYKRKRKWITLGRTKQEMHAKYYELLDRPTKIYTMNDLINRYMQEVAPTKAPRTYKDNQAEAERLRAVFKDMEPPDITPVHIYQYLDERAKKAAVRANREKALLSSMFSFAIRWGVVKDNPCKQVRRLTEKPRKRYIQDWEFEAVYAIAPPMIQCAMEFAYLTSQRIGDILDVEENDMTSEGIRFIQNKGKEHLIVEWSDALTACVNRMRGLSEVRSLYLFCRRDGQRYTSNGFKAIWQRVMAKALEENVIQERFTFHDIRKKSCSDEKTPEGKRRLGHRTAAMMARYDVAPKKYKPLK